MEATSRFELENGGFADLCLTTWLCRLMLWSGRRDLNPRLQPWQGCTLPLSYSRAYARHIHRSFFLEATSRFELESGGFADLCLTTWLCRLICWSGRRDLNPRLQPWQGCTLPLSYSRAGCGIIRYGKDLVRSPCRLVERETGLEPATFSLGS
jgi:hypothetical protein